VFRTSFWPQSIETGCAQLVETIRELWPDRFSAEYVRARLWRLVWELVARPIELETQRRFTALLAELDCFTERKLCVASVEGVRLEGDEPPRIGPFFLRRATPGQFDRIFALAPELRGRAEKMLAGSVLLELEVLADAEQAHEVFAGKAAVLMDLFQMSTTIADFCGSARVGLRGHPHTGSYSAWILPLNPGGWFQTNEITGGVGDLHLSEGNLLLMRRAGVVRLAEALGRKATRLESALFRAVHWYAQATLQEHVGQGILCLVVCLEAVLSSSSGRAMAESVALQIGATPQRRRQLYALVQEAYAVRNRVVHEGNAAHHFSRQREFRQVVREFITATINLCSELDAPECLIRRVGELRLS
jgi:hypothetical protein